MGTNVLMVIDVTLEDGTFYSNALQIDWLQMKDNLILSTNSDAISVNEDGYHNLHK